MTGEVVNCEWAFDSFGENPEMTGFAEDGVPVRDYRAEQLGNMLRGLIRSLERRR